MMLGLIAAGLICISTPELTGPGQTQVAPVQASGGEITVSRGSVSVVQGGGRARVLVRNDGPTPDRLIGVRTPVVGGPLAAKVILAAPGGPQIQDGDRIPPQSEIGDTTRVVIEVPLDGVTSWDTEMPMTLTFERAGEITIQLYLTLSIEPSRR